MDAQTQAVNYISAHSWAAGLLLSIVLSCLGIGGKMLSKVVKRDRRRLQNVDDNLSKMMSNHLPHLQVGIDSLGTKQDQTNALLGEQSGYLKAIAERLNR